MSQSFAQFVPANSARPYVGVSRNLASAPRFNLTVDKARSILGLEIRRGLQVHRRLAIGLALIGIALALIYLLNSWSIRNSPSLNEPAFSSHIAESSLNGMTTMGPLPNLLRTVTAVRYAGRDPFVGPQPQSSTRVGNNSGLSGLAAAAVAPWSSADSGVIRNALVLILSFVFLGGAIAVIAHRADHRVYIASDVEQLLGFPPMAQLPDFSEVANEITDEHLLRLASGIDLGFRDRSFRRCVITGTGPQVGVTTVATRVKTLLETMGRTAVVADAAEIKNRAEDTQSEMVLVDSAPLGDSEETERLVQSAHCTIVVIESGVTTRAQLRIVANILQRVKAPAVGFVLNRVHLATADPEFRRSIREMGEQLRKQGQTTDRQMLQTLEQAIEEGRASIDLEVAASPNQPDSKPRGKPASTPPLFNEFSKADLPMSPNQTAPAVLSSVRGLQLVPRSLSDPAKQTHEEIPLLPAEKASQFDQLHPEPKAESSQASPAAPIDPEGSGTSNEPSNPAPIQTTRVSLPRLSDLRGMRFSQALRELDLAKHPASPGTGIEMLMNAIAPFETMFARMESAPAKNDDSPEASAAESDLPASLRAFIPISESGLSPEAKNGAANGSDASGHHWHSDAFSHKPEQPAKNERSRGEEDEQSRPEQKVASEKLSGPFEQVQILPSRRGQYRKKS